MLKIAYHPAYVHPVPDNHRFPMAKYELIPAQLMHEGLATKENFFEPLLADRATLCLAHDSEYVDHLLHLTLDAKMIRRIGFALSQSLIIRERLLVDGTIKACHYAQQYGVAFNAAGGTHHAGRDFGEGFCLLNDQAVAAAYLLHQKLANRILIVDLDVHQGNGTAHIFRDHRDIFTFSMHGEKNYPFVKEQSHHDVGLNDGIGDADYLTQLLNTLKPVFEKVKPDFVFYQAGVDVLATDKLGKLGLTAEGCRQRDEIVFDLCRKFQAPVQVSMGGGYSEVLRHIVDAHVSTYRTAIDLYNL
ncbi:histone deacetylase family protein [Sphingobacterium chungjuense]|uniref:histone deacetylase family protein n=1 Tax=Sphingobacterium chungjuense TaxID=2675553 RepID=UPI00293B9BC2|nr:histone deacetylase [Sphingobacterium chungjuense]